MRSGRDGLVDLVVSEGGVEAWAGSGGCGGHGLFSVDGEREVGCAIGGARAFSVSR